MKQRFNRLASLALALVFAGLTAGVALAQSGNGATHTIEGTYNVSSASAEMGTITFLMIFKKSGDQWMVEIKDSPIPLTISKVTVDAENNLVLIADAGGTAGEIKGKFDAGKIKGNWTAGELKGTWEATRKEEIKAAVAAPPTASAAPAAAAGLEGTYDAKVGAEGQGELPFTLVVKKDGDKLKIEVPDGGVLNIVDIKIDGDNVTLVATYQGQGPIMLPGKRNGEELSGKWEYAGLSGTWKATKKK
jgi:hypothetical protein